MVKEGKKRSLKREEGIIISGKRATERKVRREGKGKKIKKRIRSGSVCVDVSKEKVASKEGAGEGEKKKEKKREKKEGRSTGGGVCGLLIVCDVYGPS